MKTLDDIRPGLVLGRYEFLAPIARGGMAAVWAARAKGARGFSKIVAVKTMLPAFSDNTEFEQMFLDEARVASRIRHPHVVEILDLGEQDDVLYLVMEWVDGEALVTLMRAASQRTEGVPLRIGVKIMADAALGLHAAHQLKNEEGNLVGLVHRDISPQNILLSYEGIVKLVDFGVAKSAGRLAATTTSGTVKGKVPFMAPEQIVGGDIDRRTDVFAMGILLYQLTTGKHPFRGENDALTLSNIVQRPVVPPKRIAKTIYPSALEDIVMKALERDPESRFQTAQELFRALDEVFPRGNVRATAEDVEQYVTELLGEKRLRRREQLAAAIEHADLGAEVRDDRPPPTSSVSERSVLETQPNQIPDADVARLLSQPPPEASTLTRASITSEGRSPEAPAKRSRGAVFAAVALVLGGVGVGAWISRRGGESAAVSSSAAEVPKRSEEAPARSRNDGRRAEDVVASESAAAPVGAEEPAASTPSAAPSATMAASAPPNPTSPSIAGKPRGKVPLSKVPPPKASSPPKKGSLDDPLF